MEQYVDEWLSILEDHLQCMVCLEIPTTSVTQCIVGHHVCTNCKMKLNVCPLCDSMLTQTRNFLAESLCAELNKMKLYVLEKKEQLSTKTVSVYTQTDLDVCKITGLNETDLDVDNNKLQMYHKWIDMAPLVTKIIYPCIICPCTINLSYERLIGHIKQFHGDIFYEEDENISSRTWKVDNKIPQSYYFAFHIRKMGLFVLNIIVRQDKSLCIIVRIINSIEVSKMFNFTFTIGNGKHVLCYSQKVISCLLMVTTKDYLFVHRENLHRIGDDNPFDCCLSIKRVILNSSEDINTRKTNPQRLSCT